MCLCSCVISTHVAASKLTGEAAEGAVLQWHPLLCGGAEFDCFGQIVLLLPQVGWRNAALLNHTPSAKAAALLLLLLLLRRQQGGDGRASQGAKA